MRRESVWKIISTVELVAAAIVILLDLLIPTLIVLALCAISLLVRKQGFGALGFKKVDRPLRMIGAVLALVLAWTLLLMAVIMPVLNHLTGTTQDLSDFESLKGNLGSLAFLLLASWTLAAFGEEIVYRGYLQLRLRDLAGDAKVGILISVGISSLLFGLAHSEQGMIGIGITFLDAVFFSLVKLKFNGNLWAAVLAHGLSNTIGLIVYFFVGPIYGFW